MTTPVVGIDLGTTNTVVGVVKEGHAAALADENGERLIPSVVSFHPNGGVLVGRNAKERRLVDASNTVYSIKRLIGRSWDSEEVKKARQRFPFEMREGPGQAALVVARGQSYTLPEISAFVLRRAKAVAEAAIGGTVERAVITVPANFNDLQRAATKVAGRVAGLEVLRILNEPTAAALAYGYGRGATERLAVYDFGGGTFDVTLLDLSENVFEVLATAGNTFLGGDDIDLAIAENMARDFLARHKYDARADGQAFERLRAAAEELKIKLSRDSEASIKIPEVAHGPGGRALDFEFRMTRADFERMLAEIVDKTFDVCREALGIARLSAGDFDQVLLVGGSTRIPLVRQRVEDFFKRPVLGHISPDEVVAIGAAIQASALTGAERRRDIPHPPQPASRSGTNPNLSRGTNPQITKGGTLPPGAVPPGGPSSLDPGTEPYGGRQRGRMPTNPGLHDSTGRDLPPGGPRVVVPPTTVPHSAIPVTHDQQRPRPITRPGPSQVPVTEPPGTVSGLGARGRVPTGTGLGPDAAQAAAARGRTPVGTLTSAQEAAQKAMALSETSIAHEPPGVVITNDPDAEHSGVTLPKAPGAEDVTAEGAQVASFLARYSSTPALARRSQPMEPSPPPPVAPPPAAARRDESVPAYRISDEDIAYDEPVTGQMEPVTAQPTTAELRRMAGPQSTDEVTEVHRRRTGSRATGLRSSVDESALPIPGLADDDKTYDGVTAPHGQQAVERQGTLELRQMPPPPPVRPSFQSEPTLGVAQGHPPGSTGSVPTQPRRNPLAPVSTMVSPPVGGIGIGSALGPPTAPIATAPMHAVPEPQRAAPPSMPNVLAPPQYAYSPPPPDPDPPWGAALGTPYTSGPPGVTEQTPFVPHAPAATPYASPAQQAGLRAPLLVDVTPLTLNVETVQGYCDAIIGRNTPVPCERSRTFVTAADNQTVVRVRVGQGESKHFRENTVLGEIELSGLRPAPRGQVKIEVAFTLDTDGILNVKATDVQTGHEARAALKLVAVPDMGQVSDLAQRQAGIPLMS